MIDKVIFKVSKKGVPHTLVEYKGHTFSICYFGKSNMYRIFLSDSYESNVKLLDVGVSGGGGFGVEFVLDGLIEKYKLL